MATSLPLTRDIAQACQDYARQLRSGGEDERASALEGVAESYLSTSPGASQPDPARDDAPQFQRRRETIFYRD